MQDENSQFATCRACKALPGQPCLGVGGAILERVHWGRPAAYDAEAESRYCHTCGQPYIGECQNTELHRRIEKFRNTERPAADPDEWSAAHTGKCQHCGKPARLYAEGWRCEDHPPVGSQA
jgi:hypothetical protein